MMPLWLQILLALGVDLLLGDPRWLPHPICAIGRLALRIEIPLRRRLTLKLAGIVAVAVVIAATLISVLLIQWLSESIHPLFGDLVAIYLLYSCFAMQSLRQHALAVFRPLQQQALEQARRQVAMLVGRDTDELDESEIVRATVESVAENSVDGVTAPLIFALLFGVPGAFFYKAVNTLDSTFGYRNARYLQFGWAAARLDDLINFIPARITALLAIVATWICGYDWRGSWRIFRRDRNKHPSPNGGQIEAVTAGALGVRLGGENSYFGIRSFRSHLGDPSKPLESGHILQTIRLMLVTTVLVVLSGVVLHLLIMRSGS
jgi:adenosylcobinamide-phosphate synthase